MAIHPSTAVGVFNDRGEAERAIQDLQANGFSEEDIGFAIRNGGVTAAGATDLTAEEPAAGAATGALTGGILGGLIGAAAALLVPGIGPVVAGGVLASALGGAAIGAAAGGLLGALTGMGVPEEEAQFYEQEFQAGRAVVTVRTGARYTEAAAILSRNGARGVPDRAAAETETARAGAMTGAVQAETEDSQAILTSVGEERGRLPGTTDEIASQAHVAQDTSERPNPRPLP